MSEESAKTKEKGLSIKDAATPPGIPVAVAKRLRRRRLLLIGSVVVTVVLGALFFGGKALLGIHTVRAMAPPLDVSDDEAFPHFVFGDILGQVVINGRVDYQTLINDAETFRHYMATLETIGPETRPELFPTDDHRLAYYLNAYNALVLLGVVEHWPVSSVLDVQGIIEPRDGFGFFWATRFVLDGDGINLYDLETFIREEFLDARIHAALNCASADCPPLLNEAYVAERLEVQLESASRLFASQPPFVAIDDNEAVINLSPIYTWYEEDFVRHAQELGLPGSVLDWIAFHAQPVVTDVLARAVEDDFQVNFVAYDWSLNDISPTQED